MGHIMKKTVSGIIFLLGLLAAANNLAAVEFGYEVLAKDKILFKTAGETFIFNGGETENLKGLRLETINKTEGSAKGINTFGAIISSKNKKNEPGFIVLNKLLKVEPVLDNDITKKISCTLSASKYTQNPDTFIPIDTFELNIVFQIYNNIPAISLMPSIKNCSTDTLGFELLWESSYKPGFFTAEVKGKPEIRPNLAKEAWRYQSACVFLHNERNSKEGIGVIAENGKIVFTPSVYVNSKQFAEIAPMQQTGLFKITYIAIKQGYEEVGKIDKEIKVLQKMEDL